MQNISKYVTIENISVIDSSRPYCLDGIGLLTVCEGNARVSAGDEIYSLQTGDLLLTAPRTICRWQGEGVVSVFAFECDGALSFGAFRTSSAQSELWRQIAVRRDAALYPLIELLLCEQDDFARLAPTEDRDSALFARAVAILREDVSRRLSVEELAEEMGLSRSHIKRLFAQYAGMGAHDYDNLLKICRAKELLAAGETVTRTAELTGFANQAYFSAAFKRIAGISPKDFAPVPVARRPVAAKKKETSVSRRDLPDYLL